MPIDIINTIVDFKALQSQWDSIYEADNEAHIFLSWQWLHDNYERHPERQFSTLAWYPGTGESPQQEPHPTPHYRAFLPLGHRLKLNKQARRFEPIVSMTGSYWADYTGALCDPSFAVAALKEMSDYLANLPCYQIRFDNLRCSAERQKALLSGFSSRRFKRRSSEPTDDHGQTSLALSPVLALAKSDDEWLASLGANTRQKIRRFGRKLDASDELAIRLTTADTLEQDLAAFKAQWIHRWKHVKGKSVTRKADYYATLIRDGIQSRQMYLRVLTCRGDIVASTACYVDQVHQTVLFFVASRRVDFDLLPSGLILHAQNIRAAIAARFDTYDLLRGNEDYKYALGATDTRVTNVRFRPRQVPAEARLLPDRLKKIALQQLQHNIHDAKAESVDKVFSQLLESYPNDGDVLRPYLKWLQGQGLVRAAKAVSDHLKEQAHT